MGFCGVCRYLLFSVASMVFVAWFSQSAFWFLSFEFRIVPSPRLKLSMNHGELMLVHD